MADLCLILSDIDFSRIRQLNPGAVEIPDLLKGCFFQKKGLANQGRCFRDVRGIIPE